MGRKIKAKKPSKKRVKKEADDAPAQRSSPVPYIGPETLVGPYPIDEEALRKLKRLHDDGIIDDDEFRQGKAKALGITPNNGPPTPNEQVGTVYRPSNPPPPPSPKVEKKKKKKKKLPNWSCRSLVWKPSWASRARASRRTL